MHTELYTHNRLHINKGIIVTASVNRRRLNNFVVVRQHCETCPSLPPSLTWPYLQHNTYPTRSCNSYTFLQHSRLERGAPDNNCLSVGQVWKAYNGWYDPSSPSFLIRFHPFGRRVSNCHPLGIQTWLKLLNDTFKSQPAITITVKLLGAMFVCFWWGYDYRLVIIHTLGNKKVGSYIFCVNGCHFLTCWRK